MEKPPFDTWSIKKKHVEKHPYSIRRARVPRYRVQSGEQERQFIKNYPPRHSTLLQNPSIASDVTTRVPRLLHSALLQNPSIAGDVTARVPRLLLCVRSRGNKFFLFFFLPLFFVRWNRSKTTDASPKS